MSTTLTRRNFIAGAAGVAAMGALSAVAIAEEAPVEGAEYPADDTEYPAEGAEGMEGMEGGAPGGPGPMGGGEVIEDPDWRTAPSEADFQPISAEYDCEVLVVGTGYAGSTCMHKAAYEGKQVIGFDKQYVEAYDVYGGDIGTMNSTMQLETLGVPYIEPTEFYTNYQMCCANRAEPGLLSYYAHHAGEAFDFFTSSSPNIDEQLYTECWGDDMSPDWTMDCGKFQTYPCALSIKQYGSPQVPLDQINDAVDNYGAQQFWAHDLKMLTVDEDGRVTGAIAQDRDTEEYVKFNASDAVVVACGDFSCNASMVRELLTEVMESNPTTETPSGSGRDGMGQKAMYWAGAAFEIGPRAGMGGVSGNPMGIWMGSHICLIDKYGDRFCNEMFAHNFISGIPAQRRESGLASVFGSNFYEPLSRGPIGHLNISDMSVFDAQKEVFTPDHEDSGPDGFDYNGTTVYCSNDPLTLAGYLGYEGEAAENFAASIERYNQMAETGVDDDFDKPESVFQPIEPPYFATYTTMGGGAGMLVTLTGMFGTKDCQIRHQDTFAPIPGLYACGNCLGGRFPLQYTSPINGISISWALTSGYQAGEVVSKL